MLYISNAFSPLMLGKNREVVINEIDVETACDHIIAAPDCVSIISHEVTAGIVSAALGIIVDFNRINVTLEKGDSMIAVIPSFRAEVAREFTKEEVMSAPLRCFSIFVY